MTTPTFTNAARKAICNFPSDGTRYRIAQTAMAYAKANGAKTVSAAIVKQAEKAFYATHPRIPVVKHKPIKATKPKVTAAIFPQWIPAQEIAKHPELFTDTNIEVILLLSCSDWRGVMTGCYWCELDEFRVTGTNNPAKVTHFISMPKKP